MSTMEKIVLSSSNVFDWLDKNFNEGDFESTMPEEEVLRLTEESTDLWGIDDEKAQEIADRIPLSPGCALGLLVIPGLGRDYISYRHNLADVEKAFGADWLDRFEADYEQHERLYSQGR